MNKGLHDGSNGGASEISVFPPNSFTILKIKVFKLAGEEAGSLLTCVPTLETVIKDECTEATERCLRLYNHFSRLDKKSKNLIDFLLKVCYNKTKRRKSC